MEKAKLDRLRELARAATPGPWTTDEYDGYVDVVAPHRERFSEICEDVGSRQGPVVLRNVHTRDDGRFVAALDPATVLGLLDGQLDAEAAAAHAREETRHFRELLDTLLHWHERGHIDESWWDEARTLLGR